MKNKVMNTIEIDGKQVKIGSKEWIDNLFKNYKPTTIAERLQITLNNIEFQGGIAYFDDIEKLECIVNSLKSGKNINDDFSLFN